MENASEVLLLFAHPAFQKSRVNRALLQAAGQIPGIYIHDLYELYHDMLIDVQAEQSLLSRYSRIVWQHPFYWYSAPALLKQWFDLVLQHGWAYGHSGNALAGKKVMHVLTAGGPQTSYSREGGNRYSIPELTLPFRQTAALCQMEYLEPYVVYGAHKLNREEMTDKTNQYRLVLEEFQSTGAYNSAQSKMNEAGENNAR